MSKEKVINPIHLYHLSENVIITNNKASRGGSYIYTLNSSGRGVATKLYLRYTRGFRICLKKK